MQKKKYDANEACSTLTRNMAFMPFDSTLNRLRQSNKRFYFVVAIFFCNRSITLFLITLFFRLICVTKTNKKKSKQSGAFS